MHLNFFAFRENRLSVAVRTVDSDQPMNCRLAFLKEPKKDRQGNIQTICNLNINMSEKVSFYDFPEVLGFARLLQNTFS